MLEKPKLSIVIPVYNEQENLAKLCQRLLPVVDQVENNYEIIFVDDGSQDQTLLKLKELHQANKKIKVLSFSRNFGHMIALAAGLDHASGQAAIVMDADLQHPPELIPEMVAKWQAGAEIVNCVRQDPKSAGWLKKTTAGFFYCLINKIAKINIKPNTADFRLLDSKVIAALNNIKERSRFLRGLISWIGFKQVFLPYQAEDRFAGKTKYSFSKMFSFALDGITSFSSFPLRLASYLGLLIASLSFFYIVYALYIRFFTKQAIAGWTSVLVAVLFIGGVQLIFLGVIGEYLGRVFEETKQRPLYIVNQEIGF